MPRLDYSGGATCPSLLLEPSRVNALAQSEYLGAWGSVVVGTGVTPVLTANAEISPEGVQNAYEVTFNSGAGTTSSDISMINYNIGGQGAGDYTLSFYAKVSSGTDKIIVRHAGGFNYTTINLTDQWQRFDVTENLAVSGTITIDIGLRRGLTNEPLNSSVTCQIYGIQLESGSYPTSYIPTYGSASTRGADLALKGSVSSLINDAEGTIFIEASTFENGADCRVGLSDNTINNRVSIEWDANADTLKGFIGIGGNLETTSYDQTNRNKIAITYDSTDARMYVNGTKVDTDTSVPTLSGMDRIDFSNYGAGIPFEGNAHQMLVFKTKLTDAEAIALTTI